MKAKFRLTDPGKIAYDPETGICWTGDKVIESEITTFVTLAVSKKLLEQVEEEKKKEKDGEQDSD